MTHNTELRSIAERMAQHAEHVTLPGVAPYQPRRASTERFKRWLPTVVYSRAPLLAGGALPSFYGVAVTHIAMGLLHTARGRFGSDAVARHFLALAQAAKRRAVRQIQERIARAKP
jgi:hypothetical protein